MGNIESMTRDILMEELTPELVKRIAKALEINKHLTSTYALTVSVEDILSTDRNPDPSKSGFYFILEGTRSGVNFFYNNNLEFSRKPNSKSVRVVKRYNNLRGFEESFWLKWADKWLKNPLTESVSETVKDKTGREFKISTEVFDSYGSQLYCGKIAHTGSTWLDENDRVKKSDLLGYIDYSVIDNVAYINMIEVKESERRKGIATELIKSMEKDYDKVQWGYTTDDGTALHKGIYGEGLVEKIIKKSTISESGGSIGFDNYFEDRFGEYLTSSVPYGPTYITPDGSFLDIGLLAEDMGDDFPEDFPCHGAIQDIMMVDGMADKPGQYDDGSPTLRDNGYIRLNNVEEENNFIELSPKRPTAKQYIALESWLDNNCNNTRYMKVAICTPKFGDCHEYSYRDYITDDIIKRIKRYYTTGNLIEKIIKKSDGYYVTSEDGKKNLGGPYDTEDKAKRRLQQVHYFKNKKKVNEAEDRESLEEAVPSYYDGTRYVCVHGNMTVDEFSTVGEAKKFAESNDEVTAIWADWGTGKGYTIWQRNFGESLDEGAEGKREPGYEYIIYDYTDEDGPNPIVAKRSTRTEAEYLAMRWMDNDYITHSRPHPKYKDRYLTFEKVPKGKFKVGDDFYGPFDADYNKLESVNEDIDNEKVVWKVGIFSVDDELNPVNKLYEVEVPLSEVEKITGNKGLLRVNSKEDAENIPNYSVLAYKIKEVAQDLAGDDYLRMVGSTGMGSNDEVTFEILGTVKNELPSRSSVMGKTLGKKLGLKRESVNETLSEKDAVSNAIATAMRDDYNQIVYRDSDGNYLFHRDYPSYEKWDDGETDVKKIVVYYDKGIRKTKVVDISKKVTEALNEAVDIDSLIGQNLRPMQLFAKAFALDPHLTSDNEKVDKLCEYAKGYFKEHPAKLEDTVDLEMLDQYDLDDGSIDVDLRSTEPYWPHEFNVANGVLEDWSEEILVHKTDEPGVVYIVSEFGDGFTTMENLKKYFMDENTFNYNLQEYVKDYLGESLTEAKRYSPWDFGDEGGFFTREELDEFTSELQDIAPDGVAVYKAYIDSNNILEVDWSYQDYEETSSMKIDMRKIKRPSDLIKRYLSPFKFLIDSKVNEIEMEINESVNLKESSLVKDTVELGDGMLEWGWEKPNSYYVEKTYWTDKDNSLAKSDFKRYYISPEAAKAAFNRYKRKFTESSNRSIHRNKRLNESISWDYFDKFEDVTQEYMPYSGEGETLASQLVTAINKLIYKWYNDGDVYDNQYTLEGWANDLSSYANWMSKYIDGAEDILSMIKTAEDSSDYEFILKLLADTFLGDKEYLDMLSEQPKDGSIYECSGKYKFIDRDNEDDFDYWDEIDDEEDEDDDYYDDEEEEEEED